MVTGAIAPRRLELQHHLPGAVDTEPLVGDESSSGLVWDLPAGWFGIYLPAGLGFTCR